MNQMPTLALLAGGTATRMRPLTERVPKSLLAVAGEPFIAHQLRLIKREGIARVVLCVGHLREQIESFVGGGERFALEVVYSEDGESLLGTGGAIRNALDQLGDEFLIMYGDSFLDTCYAPIVDAFRAARRPALMTVYNNEGKWDRSNVWFENGCIRSYNKSAKLEEMRHIDWGLSVVRAEVFRPLMLGRKCDLGDVFTTLAERELLAGYEVATRFYEIGSIEGLREFDLFMRQNAM